MIKVKKILAILMIIIIFISLVVPINTVKGTYSIEQLKSMYPTRYAVE